MDDQTRLRQEYQQRSQRLAGSDRYSAFNPANLFAMQSRERNELALLRQHGCYPLTDKRILEVGCGNGNVLLQYLLYGAQPSRVFGFDLLSDRAGQTKLRLPNVAVADGRHMPYPASSFDLILQYTVFSSILDDVIKAQLAAEMLRLLAPGGLILWYDFWWNPVNRQTRGIRPREIRSLFPGCRIRLRKLTLAPPLTRRIVPVSWGIAYLLERLGLANTHYLAVIHPQG